MAIAITALLALAAVLAAAVVVLALQLRRPPAPPAVDAALVSVQAEIGRLAGEIAALGERVPKEVGGSLTLLRDQVAARLSENAQALQKAAADTGRLFTDVQHRLGELRGSSQQILELGQDIRGLQQIFQAPKIRGGLGELTLESLLKQVFAGANYSLQHGFKNGDRVDAVIRLPGGLVPIDSKFPLAGFRALLDAQGPEARQKARRQFAREVRKHVEDIAAKYIRPAEGTLDYALMYIPAENVFYEVIARDEAPDGEEDISSFALKHRIVPVSPNSLYAYVQAIAWGLMGLKIEERARDILRRLQQLQGDFGQFRDAFDLGQRHLKNAQSAFSDAGDRARGLEQQIDQFARAGEEGGPARIAAVPPRSLEQ
jgi:DNA recombination protein RmuC